MRLSRPLLAAGVAATTVLTTAPPALAADATHTVSWDGAVRGRATWTDLVDTLCVKAVNPTGIDVATATIRPADGTGKTFQVSDHTDTSGQTCTGNLSIPEDERYLLTVQWDSQSGVRRTSAPLAFYT